MTRLYLALSLYRVFRKDVHFKPSVLRALSTLVQVAANQVKPFRRGHHFDPIFGGVAIGALRLRKDRLYRSLPLEDAGGKGVRCVPRSQREHFFKRKSGGCEPDVLGSVNEELGVADVLFVATFSPPYRRVVVAEPVAIVRARIQDEGDILAPVATPVCLALLP